MALNQEEATRIAIKDLSNRLNVDQSDIVVEKTESVDFPNASLGAGQAGEMSAQMIMSGWRILLGCKSNTYEYRGARNQVRLFDFEGQNYKVYP
jgi:hypothetical protein